MTTIKWLVDPYSLTYVRESRAYTEQRQGKIKLAKGCTLVAYEQDVPPTRYQNGFTFYQRRYWWLKNYDWDIAHSLRGLYSPRGRRAPSEAVVPSSISVDRESTPFVWG